MEDIMNDIEAETGKKLALVIASHAHRDHISGFGKFEARFADFRIGEVWLPWTDDPKDRQAAKLRKKQLALYDKLDRHLRLTLKAKDGDRRYGVALDALANLRGNEPATAALRRAFGVGETRYLRAGNSLARVKGISGLSVEVLGPSRDQKFLSRMDPPAEQRYLAGPGDATGAVHPFPTLEIRPKPRELTRLKKQGQPFLSPLELKRLNEAAEAPADRLALALDNVRNNSSLVLLLRYRGKTMLFPGDAQWGGWQSWIGTDEARRLLGELDFLKVAHHGSHNATPVDVVEALPASGLAAMVPTQVKPFPTIPRKPLLTALEAHCVGHRAVRSDWVKVSKAPAGPKRPARLPAGFKVGNLWIDYKL